MVPPLFAPGTSAAGPVESAASPNLIDACWRLASCWFFLSLVPLSLPPLLQPLSTRAPAASTESAPYTWRPPLLITEDSHLSMCHQCERTACARTTDGETAGERSCKCLVSELSWDRRRP